MPWPFKKEETDRTEAFAKDLFSVHEGWESRVDSSVQRRAHPCPSPERDGRRHRGLRRPWRRCSGSTVAEGGAPDRVVRFAAALDRRNSVEAALPRGHLGARERVRGQPLARGSRVRGLALRDRLRLPEHLRGDRGWRSGSRPSPAPSDDEQLDRIFDLAQGRALRHVSAQRWTRPWSRRTTRSTSTWRRGSTTSKRASRRAPSGWRCWRPTTDGAPRGANLSARCLDGA